MANRDYSVLEKKINGVVTKFEKLYKEMGKLSTEIAKEYDDIRKEATPESREFEDALELYFMFETLKNIKPEMEDIYVGLKAIERQMKKIE